MLTTKEITTCYQCKSKIESYKNIYKACDTNQCSYKCMIDRCEYIETIDPEFKQPTSWTSFQNINQENYVVMNNRRSPIKKTISRIWISQDELLEENKNNLIKIIEIRKRINYCYYANYSCFNILYILFILFIIYTIYNLYIYFSK